MTAPSQKLANYSRSLGLGKLKLYGFHRPVDFVRRSIAEGGPLEQWRTECGRRAMVEAATRLPPLPIPQSIHGASAHFLSGHRFWHQTVFCFASLQINSPFHVTPIIYDDGTLDGDIRRSISRVIPWAGLVSQENIMSRLDDKLPDKRFPTLRAHRLVYPHLRKLVDIHVGSNTFQLVLDSDMLFFRTPEAVLNLLQVPKAMYMQDKDAFYGYPIAALEALVGKPILSPVNVGLYMLDGSGIDWDKVEHWCRHLLENYGPHYLLEQALTAMLLSEAAGEALPRSDYIVLPDKEEGFFPQGILHHYVSHSKRPYYQHGWRQIASKLRSSPQHVTSLATFD